MNINNTSQVKKRPGRPRKKPLKKPMERKGISSTPISKDNIVELIYDTPYIFKKIFTLFKSMAVQTLCFDFSANKLIISTIDHLKKSKIEVTIFSEKTNHYFCRNPIKVYLNPSNMERILQVLDKNYISIAFVIRSVYSRSSMTVIYKNEIKIDEIREINLVVPQTMYCHEFRDIKSYPVRFELPAKFFKKFINDVSSFSNIMSINKINNTPLTFTYSSKDKSVKSRHIVTDSNLINLYADIKSNDIFSSSIQIDYIKPLSSSLLGDTILICCDKKLPTLFRIEIDKGTIILNITTEIYNLKN